MPKTNFLPQHLQKYLLPSNLTQNGSQITATIFGTAYNVGYSGLLAANTIYYIYWDGSSIVFVTTVPSTYRVSFPNSYLIAAFIANGLSSVGFGSFMNIIGTPCSDIVQYLPVVTSNAGGSAANFAVAPTGNYIINGHKVYVNAGFQASSGGLSGLTAGALIIKIPSPFSSSGGVSDSQIGSLAGHFSVNGGGFSPIHGAAFFVFGGDQISFLKSANTLIQITDTAAANFSILMKVEIGIGGLSEKPLVER